MHSLSWAVLQERITTTPYTSLDPRDPQSETFTYAIVLNTVQSAFASLAGYVYLLLSSRNSSTGTPSVFPTQSILFPLLLVSITSSLASPFGYASLKHVGYITFILAKSCKLLPVMALNVTIFRTRYPLYKYAVVALVTAGVAVFTVNGHNSKKSKALHPDASPSWGLFLLSINLIFDGLTNSTQDYINTSWKGYSGAQMMCAQNLISTLLTILYLLASPFLASTALGQAIGMAAPVASTLPAWLGGHATPSGELAQALAFVSRHPPVLYDVLGFAACGAVGQVFIFFTLAKFSSLLLVTITVTRKMLTMLLSVVWFGHTLTPGQWGGVGLVFGGVAAEAGLGRWEKANKAKAKAQAQKKEL